MTVHQLAEAQSDLATVRDAMHGHTHILLTELLTELLTSGLVMHYSLSNERLRVSNALLTSRLSMNSVTFFRLLIT
jgi:hypothetical protein